MKDRQILSSGTQPRVPVVSPFLHWLAIPAIVYLRSSFGFTFLRSKSVFLAFAWASLLYFIYAWLEPEVWEENWAVALFSLGASALYVIHLIAAFSRETRRAGKHDFYSGTSHLLRIPGLSQYRGNASFESALQLWIEPGLVFAVAIALRLAAEQKLSKWLLLVAAGMWLKELINYWYGLRAEKKHEDIIDDAEEKMPGAGGNTEAPLPTSAGRKPRVKRVPERDEQEHKYGELLRLMPPYDLEQAEENYRKLIKTVHPDSNDSVPGAAEKAAALNEAIEYFRRFGGR